MMNLIKNYFLLELEKEYDQVMNKHGEIVLMPAVRMWLIAVIDVATRVVLGYIEVIKFMSFDINRQLFLIYILLDVTYIDCFVPIYSTNTCFSNRLNYIPQKRDSLESLKFSMFTQLCTSFPAFPFSFLCLCLYN